VGSRSRVASAARDSAKMPYSMNHSAHLSLMEIFCADIGSVAGHNFGWFGRLSDGTTVEGTDIAQLGTAVANCINLGRSVALGFEAPLFVPFRTDPMAMPRSRVGETNPNWIGGPGGSVLATALVQVPWILQDLKAKIRVDARATLDWQEFVSGRATLFLWEAFVSGSAKSTDHVRDAEVGVNAFMAALPSPSVANAIDEPVVISILGVALLRTGWSDEIGTLSLPCLVIKAPLRPV
jgi:hypothetical protein